MIQLHSSLPTWKAVERQAHEIGGAHLRDLDAADPQALAESPSRARRLAARFLASAHHREDARPTVRAGAGGELAGARIAAMFRGDPINSTEQPRRAAYRAALGLCGPRRDPGRGARFAQEARPTLPAQCGAARSAGPTGKKIQARRERRHRRLGFRPFARVRCLASRMERRHHAPLRVERRQNAARGSDRSIDPAETLVIVCSKTFVTQETQTNANAARQWIVGALGDKRPRTISRPCRPTQAMDAFGIAAARTDSPCGIGWAGDIRYGLRSAWSRNSPSGASGSAEFLKGASDIDESLPGGAAREESAGAHGIARRVERSS